ncbi:MAG: wax ester/triacylglycerol synthase domain-containing protein [Rhodococcus sp. (in: high G+C Gram-positive bacteria)]
MVTQQEIVRNAGTYGRPMAARDAFNLYLESEHTSAILMHAFVIDQAAGEHAGVQTHADAVEFARSIMHLDPIFTHRLHRYPGNLSFPFWIEDPSVDPADHVEVTRQQPGEVDIVRRRVVELSREYFPRDGPPMWRLAFLVDLHGVDGVPEGGTVLIVKLHHSAIDGVGASDLISRMLASAPADPRPVGPLEPLPSTRRAAAKIPADIGRLVRALVRHRRTPREKIPAAGTVPATRFNGEQKPDMVCDFTWFDLTRIKEVKRRHGVTINDVMTTIMSLALSEYLRERGELPDADLSVSMPMNTRFLVYSDTANNLTIIRLNLHTTIGDPVERLLAIHRTSMAAKDAVSRVFGSDAPPSPLQAIPSVLIAPIGALTRKPPAEPTTAPLTTMSSNVSYGSGRLELRGAPVVGCFGVIPTVRGVHLTHSFRSIGSSISFSVVSTRRALPDIEHYIELVRSAATALGYRPD